MSVASQIAGVQTSVGVIQNEIAIVTQDTAAIKQSTTAIQQDTTAIKQDTATIVQDTASIKQDTIEIKQATDGISNLTDEIGNIPDQLTSIESEIKAGVRAKILTRPTTVKRGESISIQFQSESGLSPELTLYDPENNQLLNNLPMSEISDTGIYKVDVPLQSEWVNGDYTVLVSESVRGSLESMSLTVGDTTIQSLSGDIAGVQGQVSQASSAAGAARDIVEEVRRELGAEGQSTTAYEMISSLQTALDTIRESIVAIPQSLQDSPMQNSIREITELLKQVSGDNGVNLDTMYGSIDETTKDVNELQDNVERLRVLMDVNREIAEKLLERAPPQEPVIKTWFESGS